MDAESVKQMKVTELRSELQKLGLPTTGRKEELQARLLETISEDTGGTTQVPSALEGSKRSASSATGVKPSSAAVTSPSTKLANTGEIAPSITKSVSSPASAPPALAAATTVTPAPTVSTSKLSERAARFNLPASEEDRKRQRVERFGAATEGVASSAMTPLPPSAKRLGVSAEDREAVLTEERLRARQERFGIVSHSRLEALEAATQMARRQERFNSDDVIPTK